jgi:hypothetical protein
MPENSPKFMHDTSLEQLVRDIEYTAELAEAPYNKDAVMSVLNVYKDFFTGSALSLVTNTRPRGKRHLGVRYVEKSVPHDAYAMALENGLLQRQGHPIDDLIPEIQSKTQVIGYGVDLSAHRGLAKIWVFLKKPILMEDVLALSNIPDSVEQYATYFAKHDLRYVSLFALDYVSKSVNLYFMKRPGLLSPTSVSGMFKDIDFAVPEPAVFEHCVRAVTIYPTFTWDSNKLERICFGTVAPTPEMAPTHLDPLIARYVANVPFACPHHLFIYSITASPNGNFIKIENDYTGTMSLLMRDEAESVPEEPTPAPED